MRSTGSTDSLLPRERGTERDICILVEVTAIHSLLSMSAQSVTSGARNGQMRALHSVQRRCRNCTHTAQRIKGSTSFVMGSCHRIALPLAQRQSGGTRSASCCQPWRRRYSRHVIHKRCTRTRRAEGGGRRKMCRSRSPQEGHSLGCRSLRQCQNPRTDRRGHQRAEADHVFVNGLETPNWIHRNGGEGVCPSVRWPGPSVPPPATDGRTDGQISRPSGFGSPTTVGVNAHHPRSQ